MDLIQDILVWAGIYALFGSTGVIIWAIVVAVLFAKMVYSDLSGSPS